MRSTFIFFALIFLPYIILSQEENIDSTKSQVNVQSDSTIINLRNDKIIWVKVNNLKDRRTLLLEEKRKRPARFLGIGINFNGFLNPKGGFILEDSSSYLNLDYTQSIGIQLNVYDIRFRINDHFGVVTGFGFQFNNFKLKNNSYPISTSDEIIARDTIQRNIKKQTLKNTYIHLPLLLDFAPLKKRYRFSLGIIARYLINQSIKEVIDSEEGKNIVKRKENIHFNPFQLDATFEVGYRFMSIYFSYGLNPIFELNKGPVIKPFIAGIRLNL